MDPVCNGPGGADAPVAPPVQNRNQDRPAPAPTPGGTENFAEELGRLVAMALPAEDQPNGKIGARMAVDSSSFDD